VRVGGDEYIHVRVYQDLKQQLNLTSYQIGKKIDDPIEYFEP
jgi:cystatin-A/B